MASDDKVGYKRPPKHTRFKKGQSGNPKGRPPRAATSPMQKAQENILKAFYSKVKDPQGKPTSVTVFEYGLRKCLQEAAKNGNTKAFLALHKLAMEYGAGTTDAPPLKVIVEGGLPKREWDK